MSASSIAASVVTGYQRLVSPWLPSACRFAPTCSEYARLSFLEHGLIPVQREALGHVSDSGPDALPLGRDIHARHQDAAVTGWQQPAHHLDQRGLAGAIRAEQAEDFAALHVQPHAVDGDKAAEAARDVMTSD